MSTLKEEFWDRIEDVRAGMLGLVSDNRLVPMSPQIDGSDESAIWFITARGTDLVSGVEAGAQTARFVVSSDQQGLYADVAGTLELSDDSARLDKLWSVFAAAWFEDGKEDPDLRLLKFTPTRAEVSVSPESNLKFLYEIAKASLTDEKPDAGEQGIVVFDAV